MAVSQLYTKTLLPIPLEKAWDFFSNPKNLQKITPEKLSLKLIDDIHLPNEIYEGLIIQYYVKLFGVVKAYWLTEITHVVPGKLFVDEQRFGPYSFWHHRHLFSAVPEGTIMEDIVTYKIPGGLLGRALFKPYVKGQLRYIFQYRTERIQEIYPGAQSLAFDE